MLTHSLKVGESFFSGKSASCSLCDLFTTWLEKKHIFNIRNLERRDNLLAISSPTLLFMHIIFFNPCCEVEIFMLLHFFLFKNYLLKVFQNIYSHQRLDLPSQQQNKTGIFLVVKNDLVITKCFGDFVSYHWENSCTVYCTAVLRTLQRNSVQPTGDALNRQEATAGRRLLLCVELCNESRGWANVI